MYNGVGRLSAKVKKGIHLHNLVAVIQPFKDSLFCKKMVGSHKKRPLNSKRPLIRLAVLQNPFISKTVVVSFGIDDDMI